MTGISNADAALNDVVHRVAGDQDNAAGSDFSKESTSDVGGLSGNSPLDLDKQSSYKSPAELVIAPSAGKVTIAGRRLATGEIVQPEVIHLQDFAIGTDCADTGTTVDQAASGPSMDSHKTAASTGAPATASVHDSSVHTVQETTRTPQQVYLAHAAVATAAATAGGLVLGTHVPMRTAANVAETAIDPAAVVDFDCASPHAFSAASKGMASDQQQSTQHAAGTAAGDAVMGPNDAPSEATQLAVSAEDREDVAATVQRLLATGQLHGPPFETPAAPTPASDTLAANEEPTDKHDDQGYDSLGVAAGGIGDSHKQHTSTSSTTVSAQRRSCFAQQQDVCHASSSLDTSTQAGLVADVPMDSTSHHNAAVSSSTLLPMHDEVAHAAAVAGALHHIGPPVTTAAALADTATKPASVVEAASASGLPCGPALPIATRVGSLHQQHTLADFLLDDSAAATLPVSSDSGRGSFTHNKDPGVEGHEGAGQHHGEVDLAAGVAVPTDDLQVHLSIGCSTRQLSADGSVAVAAAAVPHEAVAALRADSVKDSSPERSPRHPMLRQLVVSSQSERGKLRESSGELPSGFEVADIVAATIASEERRFRLISPTSNPRVTADTPRGQAADVFLSASSTSAPSTPGGSSAVGERSSSPLSSSATRAIFDSVQSAIQQHKHEEDLVLAVARSASLAPYAGQQAEHCKHQDTAGDPSSAAQLTSAGSGESTATSSCTTPTSGAGGGTEGDTSAQAGVMGSADAALRLGQSDDVMFEVVLQDAADAALGTSSGVGLDAAAASGSVAPCSHRKPVQHQDVAASNTYGAPGDAVVLGDQLAAAVAAGAADDMGAAATGTDVAATAAGAFPAALFSAGPMPVDVPASRALAGTDLASLGGYDPQQQVSSSQVSTPPVEFAGVASSCAQPLQQCGNVMLYEPVSANMEASAGDDLPELAAMGAAPPAAAAPTAVTMQVAGVDSAAVTSGALLETQPATELPGFDSALQTPSESAAASTATFTAMPSSSSAPPEQLLQPAETHLLTAPAKALCDTNPAESAAGLSPVAIHSDPGSVAGAPQLPNAAPTSGCPEHDRMLEVGVGQMVDNTGSLQAEAGVHEAPNNSHNDGHQTAASGVLQDKQGLGSQVAGSPLGQDVSPGSLPSTTKRPPEVLNRAALSTMYDPLIVQLAMATSAPLEGLWLDASALVAGNDGAMGAARRAGLVNSSGSLAKGLSGVLMGAASVATSTDLGPGPVEDSLVAGHLAAAEEALALLDSKPQRQPTDNLSLGAGHSCVPGELDSVSVLAPSDTPAAPATVLDMQAAGGTGSV